MAKTTLAKATSDFAEAPNDLRSHLAIEAALKEAYAREILEGGKFRERLHPAGMRYTIEFANGQSASVVISNTTGKVIERTYADRGDIHADEVVRCLRGWVKSVEQAQRGGRKKTGMSKATQDRYRRIYNNYLAYSGTEDQYCKQKAKITRRTLDRAIAYCSTLKDVTQKRP